MRLLLRSLETPAANLALDEALLDEAEQNAPVPAVLRIWEPQQYFVVLGRSSQPESEVNLPACRADGVELWRRASGGGVVVAGPGCLMYALLLDMANWPQAHAVDAAHTLVLQRHAAALAPLAASVRRAGISDLTIDDQGNSPRKFSGNSLRLRRRHLLYHGSLLYDFDLARISRWLGPPLRQPDYRGDRSHEAFVANLAVPRAALVDALVAAWDARRPSEAWPQARTIELVKTKYAAPIAV